MGKRHRLLFWAVALLVGCGGPTPSTIITSITITPTSATIRVGETQTFTAVAKDADGNTLNVNFSWNSSNKAVATVSGSESTGLAPGSTEITASAGGVTSNNATLKVTPDDPPSSFQLIDEALEQGEIDEETALSYKVFATFGDQRLPVEYQGNDEGRDSTLLMTELASIFDTLSPATQATLQPFLLTPPEAGSWLELSADDGLHTQQIEWGTVVTANDKIKVWYQTRYAGDGARAQAIANEIDRIIWPKLTNLMREPLPDCGAACSQGGGDERLDIYLVNINRAYTEGSAGGASSAFILLEPTDSFAIVAHEFMHAIQFAYPMASDGEYDWLFEATATWAMDYVYPNSNMDPGFPASQEEQPHADSFLAMTETPLETTDDAHEYGAYLLPFYLAGYGREGAGTVRTMWENATQASSLAAANAALSSRGGFARVWPKVVLYNWNQEPVDDYQTWDELSNGASVATHFTVGAVGEDELPADVNHLSALYYTFEFTSERIRSVIVENPFASGSESTANVQAIVKINGQWQPPEDWTALDRKKFCRDKPEEHIEELVLIISNSEWQNRSHVLKAGNLNVKSLAEGCTCDAIAKVKQWQGNATFSYNVLADDGVDRVSLEVSADVSATLETSMYGGKGILEGAGTLDETHQTYDPQGNLHFNSSVVGSGSPVPAPFQDDESVLILVFDPVNCLYTMGIRLYVAATATDITGATSQVVARVGNFSTAWRPIPDGLGLSGSGSFPAHSSTYIEAQPELIDVFLLENYYIRQILGEDGMGTATVSWSFSPLE